MPEYTINQAEKRLGITVSTFKRWERDGKIPAARRTYRASVPVRVFSDSEITEFAAVIQQVIEGAMPTFNPDRDSAWSPFPLPNGSPI